MSNNDLISRAAALRCIMQSRENIDWGQSDDEDAFLHYTGTLYRTMASAECVPTVDAVPVVRCKDCKYAHLNDDNECTYCDMISVLTDEGESYYVPVFPPDWYCAYGEREDDV